MAANTSYQQLTSLSSAQALPSIPDGAYAALLQAETQAVRIRADGTNPTASVGHLLAAGASIEWTQNLALVRVIEAAASAKLNITYFRVPTPVQ